MPAAVKTAGEIIRRAYRLPAFTAIVVAQVYIRCLPEVLVKVVADIVKVIRCGDKIGIILTAIAAGKLRRTAYAPNPNIAAAVRVSEKAVQSSRFGYLGSSFFGGSNYDKWDSRRKTANACLSLNPGLRRLTLRCNKTHLPHYPSDPSDQR